MVGAGVGALAALDALTLVDDGLAVLEGHGVLGADLLAGAAQAPLAQIAHPHLLGGAGVAGVLNDVDERRIVVFLRHGALVDALGQGAKLRNRPEGQPHGQAHPLSSDGALQKDGLPVRCHFSRDDFIGDLLHAGVVSPFIGKSRHLGENLLADIGDKGLVAAHIFPPSPTEIRLQYTGKPGKFQWEKRLTNGEIGGILIAICSPRR